MSLLRVAVAAGLVGLQLWAVSMLVPLNAMSRSMFGIAIVIVTLLALLELYSIVTVIPAI